MCLGWQCGQRDSVQMRALAVFCSAMHLGPTVILGSRSSLQAVLRDKCTFDPFNCLNIESPVPYLEPLFCSLFAVGYHILIKRSEWWNSNFNSFPCSPPPKEEESTEEERALMEHHVLHQSYGRLTVRNKLIGAIVKIWVLEKRLVSTLTSKNKNKIVMQGKREYTTWWCKRGLLCSYVTKFHVILCISENTKS